MDDPTREALQAALGADWRVVGSTPPPRAPPGRMRLFDFCRSLYVVGATGQPHHRYVLWDGRGDWFGGDDDDIDVAAMAADLRAFALALEPEPG